MATTKKPESKSAAVLNRTVSQTDQAYLGAKGLDEDELEAEHDFNAVVRGNAHIRRDNSEYAGNSAPRSWDKVYRENATHIDIRAGVKAKEPK